MESKSRSQICYITTNKFLQVFTNFFLQDSISKVGPAASSNTPCLLWHMVPSSIDCLQQHIYLTVDLAVIEFEAHAVVNLVVLESDVVLVDVVPLLNPNLVGSSPGLSRHQLLQVAYGVVFVALHAHLLPEPVVQHHLNHLCLLF